MDTTMTMSGLRAAALLAAAGAATAAAAVAGGPAAAALGLAGAGLAATALYGRQPPFGAAGCDRLAFALAEGALDVWLVAGALALGHIAVAGLTAPTGPGRFLLVAALASATSIAPSGVVRRRKTVSALARAAAVRAAARGSFRRLRGDLRGRTWTGADLRLTDFSGADLGGCVFRDADLTLAEFAGADLDGVRFDGCDLRGAGLERAVGVWTAENCRTDAHDAVGGDRRDVGALAACVAVGALAAIL